MNVFVEKKLDFSRDFSQLVKFLFSTGGVMSDLSESQMLRSSELRKWLHAQDLKSSKNLLSNRQLCNEALFETNCISIFTALTEMKVVASFSIRCQKAAYRFTLSWGSADEVSDDAAFSAARHCLSTLDMNDHPYVAVIRRVADRTWVRILACVVPYSGGNAARVWKDADKLQYACRECEITHGWVEENGTWVIDNGSIIRPQDRDF